MKIALDCRLWNEGGVGRYIRNLVWELQKIDSKNQYDLFFYKNTNHNLKNTSTSKYKILYTNAKWHSFKEQITFWQELEQGNYNLVHFPYFSHPIKYQRPFVLTIHDLTILHYATGKATTKNQFMYLVKRLGYKMTLSHGINEAKLIIVPSQSVKKDLLNHYDISEEKVIVTYEGVGQELIKAKSVSPFDISIYRHIEPFYLYVGNFYPHKNIEFAVQKYILFVALP